MSIQLLFNHIAKHINISEKEKADISTFLFTRRVKKRSFLYREMEVHTHAVFVTAGCLRSYAIDTNGHEHVLQFAPPGWWIGDMKSFINASPGTWFIDAIEESEVIMLAKNDLENLYAQIPALERFFRILAENALAAHQHRLAGNLSLTALERYNNFCLLYPSLITQLSQKQIASYIGVTPEFLSKMLNSSTKL